MTELVTISTDNYASMAKAMGLSTMKSGESKKANLLNRLRIWHSPIMGQKDVDGKSMNVEVVPSGTYRLEIVNGDTSTYYYSEGAIVRPFMQRYMYRRYIAFPNAKDNEPKGEFHRTIMSDSLSIDLKDNTGKFNCGKPTGFVEDFKSLPTETQDLIRQIKRVRVIFGTVTLKNPVTQTGESADLDVNIPFIWEIDNKTAYKTLGDAFNLFVKKERLPLQHNIQLTKLTKNPLPNGSSFYTPEVSIDFSKSVEIRSKDNETFTNFLDWIKNYNDYIYKEWDEKANARHKSVSEEDMDVVEEFIDVDTDES